MTHDEIAEWGAKRIVSMGYPIALANCTSAMMGEQPDILGMDYSADSIVGEVKVSRSDFFADKKKPWRKDGQGMGKCRFFLTPKGLLKPEEIPYGWQLWEVHGKSKPILKVIKGWVKEKDPSGRTSWSAKVPKNSTREELMHFTKSHSGNYRTEAMWAIKLVTRMRESGIDVSKFSNGKTNQ